MKLIWHIIRKDIARDRWALLLWASLFVAQVGLGVVARRNDGADQDWVVYAQLGNGGLIWLQIVMGYILVARLVQADALIGTAMFWPTRPISVARLFTAKVLGVLLLFGLLPVLLLLPWWLYCAFGWWDILWTAVDMLGWQLLVIAPAFLVASLTDDLGRVLLWTLLLVIGLFTWIVLLQSSLETMLGTRFNRVGAAIMFSRIWVAGVVLIVGGIVIAAHQYLTRSIVRSAVLVVLGLGVIAFVGQMWPWNCAKTIGQWNRPAVPATIAGMDRITFTVEPAKPGFSGGVKSLNRLRPRIGAKEPWLNLRLRVRGLPDDLAIATESAVQTWTWPGGLKVTRDGFFRGQTSGAVAVLRAAYPLPVPPSDPETDQWWQARRDKVNAERRARGLRPVYSDIFAAHPADGQLLAGSVSLPVSFLAKMYVEPPAYSTELPCFLFQPEIVVNLPLKADARAAGRSRTFLLQQLEDGKNAKDRDECKVTIVTTSPAVAKAGLWNATFIGTELRSWFYRDYFVAVNHTTGDIDLLRPANPGSREALIGGVRIAWNPLSFFSRPVIRQGQWVNSDPQWRDHTTLVFLTDKEVALFTRAVKAEKFEIGPGDEERRDGGSEPAKPVAKP